MLEIDAIIAGVVGLVAGASPAVIQAIWRYCKRRGDQRHERHMRELEVKERTVALGIEQGYEMIRSDPDGYMKFSGRRSDEPPDGYGINRDRQDA